MERCPNCRARLSEEVSRCPRCDIELEPLYQIERAATQTLQQAIRALLQHRPAQANALLQRSQGLRRSALARRLIDVAAKRLS